MTDEQTDRRDTDKWTGFGTLADEPKKARVGLERIREQLRNEFGEEDSD